MECNIKTIFYVLLFTLSAGAEYIAIPTNYKLEIITTEGNFKDDPAGDDLRFDGRVTIDLTIKKPTSTDSANEAVIVLNSNPDMKLKSTKLMGLKKGEQPMEIPYAKGEIKEDKVFVQYPEFNSAYESYQLVLNFSNPLRNDMTGFYRSSYVDSSKKNRWLLTTHFEPIYARRAFPCFDRPDLKATFDIVITAPQSKATVLCNTPTTNENVGNEQKMLKFTCKKTLKMSTYLVAFTVSDFLGSKEEKFESDYPEKSVRTLKTYGRPDIIKGGGAELAQAAGKAAIVELSKYLSIGYAFDKIDQVGIPDFSAGAMENWGHISFREKSLFFNKQNGTTLSKQSNILTITHELVHQWFGNLVTLESWDYIWLNEAFANYLEYVIASKVQLKDFKDTDWELMKQFVVAEMHLRAFETDGLTSAKPLNNKIIEESLIEPSFNDIPYAKGASVLRMWENALGSDKFQLSLQKYLRARHLNTTNPGQLYEFFKNTAGMSKDFFTTWTEQAGYPVVEVKKVKDGYELSQKRFYWENRAGNFVWEIPISFSNETNKFDPKPTIWLRKDTVKVNNITGKWFVLNNKQFGYYRVNYDQDNWNALAEALKKNYSEIDELNRAQIINDVYSLARSLQADFVPYGTALELTKYLEKEKSLYAWKTALNAFDFVRTKLREGKVFDSFNEYILSLVKPHFKNLDFSKENHLEKLKNIEISRWACSLGLKECIEKATALYNKETYKTLPDVQEIVLCTVVKHKNVWDDIFKKYSEEEDSSLKLMYISALGCTQNAIVAKGFLSKTLAKDSNIRPQDRTFVLSSVYNGNLKHVDVAFKFIEDNYQEIAKQYGGINPLGKALVGIARKLNSEKELQRLEKLVKTIREKEEGKATKDSLDNALSIAKSNVEWVDKREKQFYTYFSGGSFVTCSLALLSLCLTAVFQF